MMHHHHHHSQFNNDNNEIWTKHIKIGNSKRIYLLWKEDHRRRKKTLSLIGISKDNNNKNHSNKTHKRNQSNVLIMDSIIQNEPKKKWINK